MKKLLSNLTFIGLLLLINAKSFAQNELAKELVEKAKSETRFEGVTNENNLLVFRDKATFDNIYQQLEKLSQNEELPDDFEIPVNFDSPALIAFEENLNFQSLRSLENANMYKQLSEGVDPTELSESWLIDDILQTLLNDKYQIKIGEVIYILTGKKSSVKIIDGNLETLAAYERGADLATLKNIEVTGNDKCDAQIGVNTQKLVFKGIPIKLHASLSLEIPFSFAGSPQSAGEDEEVTYTWTFGDQTGKSNEKNPVHKYEKGGIYEVCVVVDKKNKKDPSKSCTSRNCVMVEIVRGCQAIIKQSETGNLGEVCFDIDAISFSEAVSVEWEVPGAIGTTKATGQVACFKFPCNGKFKVFAKVKMKNGCEDTVEKTVEVTSIRCCGRGSEEGNFYLDSKAFKLKYEQEDYDWDLYTKVVAEIKHYKLGKLGIIYWPNMVNLSIETFGEVFKKSPNACTCENPEKIDDVKHKKGWHLTFRKDIDGHFDSKLDHGWGCNYFKEDILLGKKISQVECK